MIDYRLLSANPAGRSFNLSLHLILHWGLARALSPSVPLVTVPRMKFSEDTEHGTHRIDAYAAGLIRVNGRDYGAGLAVSATKIIEGWGPRTPDGLAAEHIAALLDLDPQVIVIGTGARQVFPRPALFAQANVRGVGLEVMDTGAACRTYNILVGEGRRVAVGLMIY